MDYLPTGRNIRLAFLLGALFFGLSSPLGAQARGALFGCVVDDRDGSPVVGAEVAVLGTVTRAAADSSGSVGAEVSQVGGPHRTTVDSSGVFVLTDLPLGPVQVRIEWSGYSTSVEQMDISADSLAALEVRLVPIAVMLDELLVTARQRVANNGSSVAEVRSGRASSFTAADLLARIPNLSMAADHGLLGKGAAVSIRGATSITQSDAPAIYLDGVRISDYTTPNAPGSPKALSILAQIPASDVVRIRVLRGPSAEARYGDSSNGVILIDTNREVQGR